MHRENPEIESREAALDVLLVEDSEMVRREIERALRSLPSVQEVIPCAGVGEARQRLGERSFDVWVLDFRLDDGTALDLVQDRGSAEVVVVTAEPTAGIRERCRAAGVAHFLDKAEGLAGLEEALSPAEPGRRRGAG